LSGLSVFCLSQHITTRLLRYAEFEGLGALLRVNKVRLDAWLVLSLAATPYYQGFELQALLKQTLFLLEFFA